MGNGNMDMTNNEIFRLGMEEGRRQLAEHIIHQFELGKPVEILGNLYWLKDSRQNLQDIMDDIETAWIDEHGEKKFIVPMRNPREETVWEVIIQADTAELAYLIALGEFEQGCGYLVDTDYKNYRQFKG